MSADEKDIDFDDWTKDHDGVWRGTHHALNVRGQQVDWIATLRFVGEIDGWEIEVERIVSSEGIEHVVHSSEHDSKTQAQKDAAYALRRGMRMRDDVPDRSRGIK